MCYISICTHSQLMRRYDKSILFTVIPDKQIDTNIQIGKNMT